MARIPKQGEPLLHHYVPLKWWKDESGRWRCARDGEIVGAYLLEPIRREIYPPPGKPNGSTLYTPEEFEGCLGEKFKEAQSNNRGKPTQSDVAARCAMSTATFKRNLKRHRDLGLPDPWKS